MSNQRATIFAATALTAALLSGAPAQAQRTIFYPSLGLGVSYTDNVDVVNDPNDPNDKEESDTSYTIGLDLPITRQSDKSTLSFSYQPSYVEYDTADLDYDEHRLALDWTRSADRRTTFGFSADASRTQDQFYDAVPEENEQSESGDLTQRTERDSFGAGLTLRRVQSAKWTWDAGVGWSMTDHEEIDGFSAGSDDLAQDRTEYSGSFGASRSISRGSSIGFNYQHQRFDLDADANGENEGEEDSDSLGITFSRTVGRNLSFNVQLGGFRNSGDIADGDDDDDERTGFQGSFDLRRNFRNSNLAFRASHQPTSGGDLSGTSTNTDVGLQYSGNKRLWGWDVSGRYGLRDPSDDADDDRDTRSLSGSVERFFKQQVGLRLDARYADQDDDDGSSDSVTSVNFGVVWYMRGRVPRERGRS